MRGFITDYLPSDPSDWECIEDFCGSMTFVGFHLDLNCCAYYSPSLNKTIFGGDWIEVEPIFGYKPTELQIWEYVKADKCNWSRHYRAIIKRQNESEQKSKDIIKHYKKCGSNWVTIVYKRGEEFIKLISECVGLRERMDVARMAFKFMKENCSIGTSISLFKWESGLTELEVEKRNKRN